MLFKILATIVVICLSITLTGGAINIGCERKIICKITAYIGISTLSIAGLAALIIIIERIWTH